MQNQQTTIWSNIRRGLIAALIILEVLFLFSGYGTNGLLFRLLGNPIASVLAFFSKLVGGVNATGWAIVIITAIFQLILWPIRYGMQRDSIHQQAKVAKIQPQLQKIQELAKNAATPQEQMQYSSLSMRVYQANNLSITGGINFLTMLIQMPVLSGLYSAISHSNLIPNATFFGISLEHPSIIIAIIAGALYLLQTFVATKSTIQNVPEAQRRQVQIMSFLSPALIFFFSLYSPASIGLYFVVGGIALLILSLYMNQVREKLQEKALADFSVVDVVDDLIKDVSASSDQQTVPNNDLISTPRRNAGKQNKNQNEK